MSIDNNLKCPICGNPVHPGACGGGGGEEEEKKKQDEASEADAIRADDHQNINKINTTTSQLWTNSLSGDHQNKFTAVISAPKPARCEKPTEEATKVEASSPKAVDPQTTQESTGSKLGRKNSPFNMRLTR